MSQALLVIAPLTMLVAGLGAIASRDVRTLISWSLVASAGMLVTALAIGNAKALSGAVFYLVGSTIAAAMMYLNAASLDEHSVGAVAVAADEEQLSAQWTWTGAIFVLGAAALVGLPPFSGFIGKAMILAATAANVSPVQQVWTWSAVFIAGLLFSLAFVRTGSRIFWKRDPGVNSTTSASNNSRWASAMLALLLIGVTVFAAPIQRYSDQAAVELLQQQLLVNNVLGKLPEQRSVAPPPSVAPEMPR